MSGSAMWRVTFYGSGGRSYDHTPEQIQELYPAAWGILKYNNIHQITVEDDSGTSSFQRLRYSVTVTGRDGLDETPELFPTLEQAEKYASDLCERWGSSENLRRQPTAPAVLWIQDHSTGRSVQSYYPFGVDFASHITGATETI